MFIIIIGIELDTNTAVAIIMSKTILLVIVRFSIYILSFLTKTIKGNAWRNIKRPQ